MGLDTTHECWHGSYSAFYRWRKEIAKQVGIPLDLMRGFYQWEVTEADAEAVGYVQTPEGIGALWATHLCRGAAGMLPMEWAWFKPSPLHVLLDHSDCDGYIDATDCGPLADALALLIPKLPQGDGGGHIGNWRDKTASFVAGLRAAAQNGERVEFH